MTSQPKVDLSCLREIGWSMWDPIGLRDIDPSWEKDGRADEYDTYLLRVVGLIRNGHTDAECVDYLTEVEANHIGMGIQSDARQRASNTTIAIRAYLSAFPSGPLGIQGGD